MQGLSEPCSLSYMATEAERLSAQLPRHVLVPNELDPHPWRDFALSYVPLHAFLLRLTLGTGYQTLPPLSRRLRLRLLLREVLAGGGGGGIGHDPGRVLRLGRARELLAQEGAEHLGVDADLLGKDLGRERCRHGTYLLEASASLIDAIVLSYMTRRPIARGQGKGLQFLYMWTSMMGTINA